MSQSYADTIKPKSDQLNADDLLVSPITVTVTDVKRGPEDQPVHIFIDGHQPYKPCKSMRRVIISAWGDIGAKWVGRSMTLFCDPTVKFGGVALGGIRISHMSHIDGILNIMLTQSRGRKAQFVVKPLQNPSNEVSDANSGTGLTEIDMQWIEAVKKDPSRISEIKDPEYANFIKSKVGINGGES